jgi:hypothetical protein
VLRFANDKLPRNWKSDKHVIYSKLPVLLLAHKKWKFNILVYDLLLASSTEKKHFAVRPAKSSINVGMT